MFKSVLGKVEEMGGVRAKETKLMVTSSLKEQNLLRGNTKVVYEHGEANCQKITMAWDI